MEEPPKRRTSISPSAAALASASPTASSSASTNPAETVSPSPYLSELIPLVASRLMTLEDFFALRAACRTYRALLPPSPANLASQGLLFVPHNASASEALYHAPLRCLLRFRLPRAQPGSRHPSLTPFHSFGARVAIQDIDIGAGRRELRIRHLLTGEPAAHLPDPTKGFDEVIFSGDLVLTFTRFRRAIHYCRIGDAHWQTATCHEDYLFSSLMFVKGTLYGLVCSYFPRLAVFELHDDTVELSFLGDESSRDTVPTSSRSWLAECRGELLLVVDVPADHPLFSSPLVYHVYRWLSVERKWARTTSLGPDHPAVRRDCLYFTFVGWEVD